MTWNIGRCSFLNNASTDRIFPMIRSAPSTFNGAPSRIKSFCMSMMRSAGFFIGHHSQSLIFGKRGKKPCHHLSMREHGGRTPADGSPRKEREGIIVHRYTSRHTGYHALSAICTVRNMFHPISRAGNSGTYPVLPDGCRRGRSLSHAFLEMGRRSDILL